MKRFTLLAALMLMIAATVSAAPIVFTLGDHPDGQLGTDNYGIRLDNHPGSPTFSVGTNLSGTGGYVTLIWDPADLAAGATISGDVVRNDDLTDWTVSYFLTGLTAAPNGGFIATGGNGTLSEVGGANRVIALMGKTNGLGEAFIFDNNGHRLPTEDGWVGEGWLAPSSSCCDDWLVTAVPGPPPGEEEVPEPGTISLMIIGLGMLVGGRKLRQKRNS